MPHHGAGLQKPGFGFLLGQACVAGTRGAGGLETSRFWGPTRGSAPPGPPWRDASEHSTIVNQVPAGQPPRRRPQPPPRPDLLLPCPHLPHPCGLARPWDLLLRSKCLFVLGAALLSPRVPEPGVSVLLHLPSASSCFSPGLSPSLPLPPFCSLSPPRLSPPPPVFLSPPALPPGASRLRLCSSLPRHILLSRPCRARVRPRARCRCTPASLHPSHPRPRPRPRRYRIAVLQGCGALRLLRQ